MLAVGHDISFKGPIYCFSLNNACNNPLERTLIILSKSNPIQSLRFENTDSLSLDVLTCCEYQVFGVPVCV